MERKLPFKVDQVVQALTNSGGLWSVAARPLEPDPRTLANNVDRHQRLPELDTPRRADVR